MPYRDKGIQKAYHHNWHKKNATRRNMEAKKRYYKSPAQAKDHFLKYEFGISLQDYLELVQKQNGVCAICFRPETRLHKGKVRQLSVDHNHTTGKIRALLCGSCNIALGLLDEDKSRIYSVLRYLDEHA